MNAQLLFDRMNLALAGELTGFYIREAQKYLASDSPDYSSVAKMLGEAKFWAEEAEKHRKAGR